MAIAHAASVLNLVAVYRKHMMRFYRGQTTFLSKYVPGPYIALTDCLKYVNLLIASPSELALIVYATVQICKLSSNFCYLWMGVFNGARRCCLHVSCIHGGSAG